MKHLYLQTAFLGDLLLSIPTLKAIKQWDSKAEITLLCKKGLGFYFKKLGLIEHFIEIDKSNNENKKKSQKYILKQLSGRQFDYLFCPHMSMSSHFLSMKVNAEIKVGYYQFWNRFFYDKRIKRPMHLPEALRQLAILTPFDSQLKKRMGVYLKDKKRVEKVPVWASMTMNRHFGKQILQKLPFDQNEPYICLAPGSVWNTKRWTKNGFIGVGQFFSKQGIKIVVLGAPEEKELCEEIEREIPGSASLAGVLDIWESTMILSLAKLMICNDSGAMHLASVAGTPTVSIFGPTVLGLGYQPWQDRVKIIENKQLACRPCGKHGHKVCPIGTHECMESIEYRDVIEAAKTVINQ